MPAETALWRINISTERVLLRAIDETAKARGMAHPSFLASPALHEPTSV